MKRRSLILGGLAGITSVIAWQTLSARDEDTIAMVVRKRLDYLKLDPDGVEQFAKDMAALHLVSRTRLRALAGAGSIYKNFHLSAGDNKASNLLRHGEDRIVSSYLISSDFFINGADEGRTVKYLGMLDSRRACGNPFARRPTDVV